MLSMIEIGLQKKILIFYPFSELCPLVGGSGSYTFSLGLSISFGFKCYYQGSEDIFYSYSTTIKRITSQKEAQVLMMMTMLVIKTILLCIYYR